MGSLGEYNAKYSLVKTFYASIFIYSFLYGKWKEKSLKC